MDPDNAIAHDDVAMLYLELGVPQMAVRHLEAFARLKAGISIGSQQSRRSARAIGKLRRGDYSIPEGAGD